MAGTSPKAFQKKRTKTFNRLDERFQLQPHHDPEHIFAEELELVATLRDMVPECTDMSDKMLVVFLCARRHNLEKTVELLKRYCAKRKEFGFDVNPPNLGDVMWSLGSSITMHYPGAMDVHQRMLYYYWIGNDVPRGRTLRQMYAWGFWETEYLVKTEPLKVLRNGTVVIVDMSGFGFRNLDMSSKGKEFHEAMSGVFPKRMRQICVINGGILLSAALKAARLILPKKIMKRIGVHSNEQLRALVPEQFLITQYGGRCTNTVNDWIRQIEQLESSSSPNTQVAAAGVTPRECQSYSKGHMQPNTLPTVVSVRP